MNRRSIRMLCLGAAALVALAACLNPVTDMTVSQVSDRTSPAITFSTPAEGSAYSQTVSVQGTAAEAGRLKGLAWTVTGTLGTLASGTIEPAALGASGTFSFQFGTLDFSGPIAVTVQAADWNDNVGSATRTLVSSGASLSSFAVDPGSASVQLDWEPVDGAAYTLYYTTNGSLPAQGYGLERSIGAPPQALAGLSNGALHVFLLKATAGGRDYWSGYVRAIPLAETTLAPTARGAYGAVLLGWKSIPGTGEFEVLRSTSRSAGFSNISGTIAATAFTDTGVVPGVRYFYKVRPALAGSDPSASVAGESTPFPPDAERRVGYAYPPGGQLMDVAVRGNWAFAASYNSGLQVFDVSDPSHPAYITGVSTGSDHAFGIALNPSGTIAYLGAGTFVYAFDVSTPTVPQLLTKSVSLGAQAWGVAVRGTDVFVAASSAGAIRFAAGNLSSIAGTFSTSGAGGGGAYGIAADANYVYIAAEAKAFVANPVPFTLAGSVNASRAMGIAVATRGPTTYAYVADESASALRVFDVTTPAAIGTLGTLTLTGMSPRGVSVRGSAVALAGSISAGAAALQVANVSDPAAPRLAFSVMLPTIANRVTASGDYAFVAEGLGLQVANIASPAAPVAQPSPPVLASAYTLAVDGDIAVAASFASGVRVYSLAAPASPVQLGPGLAPLAAVYGVAVRWPYAYLAESARLEVMDLSPALAGQAPVSVGSTALIGNGNDVALSGDYALVGDAANCVDIISIADPANPVVVGNFLTTGFVPAVGAGGGHGYAVTLSPPQSFSVISLANPLQPQAAATLSLALGSSQVNSLTAAGSLVYLAASNGSGTGYGMAIVDVTNPVAPVLRNTVSLGFDGRFVEVVGDYALVTPLSGSTLRVYSIANPSSPRLIGTVAQPGVAVRASGGYAFVADFSGGRFTSLALW